MRSPPPSRRDKQSQSTRTKGIEEKVKDRFTTSTEGLLGAGVGVLVGGWAADKAQSSRGKGKKVWSNDALTLLGAAIGGLAVNAAIDKWADKRGRERAGSRD